MPNSYGIPDDAAFTKAQLVKMFLTSEAAIETWWMNWGTDAEDRMQYEMHPELGDVSLTEHVVEFLDRTGKLPTIKDPR